MTLDAYDWAWNHARSRGNARLAVLAVADKTTGPDAEARLSTAEAMRRLGGVGKGVAVKALADAVDSGDLVVAQEAAGSRATLYRITEAVGYTRRTGLESGPETPSAGRSGIRTANGLRSGSQTTTTPASGPDSGPVAPTPEDGLWSGSQTACGPESGPHHSPNEGMNEGGKEGTPLPTGKVPDFAADLVGRITAAKFYLPWTELSAAEWFRVDAMLKRSGVDMLAEHAVDLAARRRAKGQPIGSPRYLLKAWQSLPEAPAPGTVAPATPAASNVVPFDRSRPAAPGRAAQAADWYADLI